VVHTAFWRWIPEGNSSLGRPRRRWEDNIKMDLQEIGWGGLNRIDQTWDRDRRRTLINVLMNLGSIKCGSQEDSAA